MDGWIYEIFHLQVKANVDGTASFVTLPCQLPNNYPGSTTMFGIESATKYLIVKYNQEYTQTRVTITQTKTQ